tara:strand:- start:1887 stop:2771 length:885 start_codon:yes stop_codon:yes gene_type:complete
LNNEQKNIIEVTTLKQLLELSSGGGGAVAGYGNPIEQNLRKEITGEALIRKYIRKKLRESLGMQLQEEQELRKLIRGILSEGDISDVHPHRSTAINVLELVLKKAIPTIRADYKRLTTDKNQRISFRAHIINAVKDALMPSMVNQQYLQGSPEGDPSALLSEPVGGGDEMEDLDADLAALEEADINLDVGEDEKQIEVDPVEEPSEEEEFGVEGMDETGRNMALTTFKNVSQYFLDAYDSLANPKDQEVFIDYLVTNLKLYFDRFEDELQNQVDEPSTQSYKDAKEMEKKTYSV